MNRTADVSYISIRMSIQTPVAPPTALNLRVAEPTPPRRHWIRVLILTLVLALAAGGIAAGLSIARYQPLCTTFRCGGISDVRGPTVTANRDATDPAGEGFTEAFVTHRPGSTFTYEFTLTNQGGHPVTVTAIGDRDPHAPWSITRMTMVPDGRNGPVKPFRPFVLAPRNPVDISITNLMRGCVPMHSTTFFGSIPITYRYLGFAHHTTLLLPFLINVEGARAENCS